MGKIVLGNRSDPRVLTRRGAYPRNIDHYRAELRKAAAKLLRELRKLADWQIDCPMLKRPRISYIDPLPRDFRVGAARCLNIVRRFCKDNL